MAGREKESNSQAIEFAHKETLPNGLRVLVHEMPWAESVSAQLLVRAGPRYEDRTTTGSAHYLEHTFFGGTQKYSSRREMEMAIESRGGDNGAYTSKEYVMYHAKVPTENAAFATEFVRELVFNSKMSEETVRREKGVIAAELRKSIDSPARYSNDLLRRLVWGNHPLGQNTLGTFESIERINRQDLLDYHGRFYKPGNSILVIAGNVTTSEAIDFANSDFGNLPGSTTELPQVPAPVKAAESRVLVEERDIKQAHILLAFATDGYGISSPNLSQIRVLTRALSLNVFYKFVYDLGYSYSAGGHPSLVSDSGYIVISVDVPPEKTEEAVRHIVREVNNLDINEKSVEEAKAGVISGSFLDLADTDQFATFIGEQELYTGFVKTPKQIKEEIRLVDVGSVEHLRSKFFFGNNAAMVVLGPIPESGAKALDKMLVFD